MLSFVYFFEVSDSKNCNSPFVRFQAFSMIVSVIGFPFLIYGLLPESFPTASVIPFNVDDDEEFFEQIPVIDNESVELVVEEELPVARHIEMTEFDIDSIV